MNVVQNPGRLCEQVKSLRDNECPLPGGKQPSRSRRRLLQQQCPTQVQVSEDEMDQKQRELALADLIPAMKQRG